MEKQYTKKFNQICIFWSRGTLDRVWAAFLVDIEKEIFERGRNGQNRDVDNVHELTLPVALWGKHRTNSKM